MFLESGLQSVSLSRATKTLPPDVGITHEGADLPLQYLQCQLVPKGDSFECHAFSANYEYTQGTRDNCKYAKFPHFWSAHLLLPTRLLYPRLWERAITFNAMAEGHPSRAREATVDVLTELVLQAWPMRTLGKGLCSIPRRHTSAYICILRRLGRELARSHRQYDELVESVQGQVQDLRSLIDSVFVGILALKSFPSERNSVAPPPKAERPRQNRTVHGPTLGAVAGSHVVA